MSEATDSYIAELEEAEARAAGLLEEAGPDSLDPRAGHVIKAMRAALNRHRREVDRIRDEARTEARQELIRERQSESNYRRLGVPPSARALFSDLDPTDQQAMQARVDELRQAGIAWPGQPGPPPPPPPDPNLQAIAAMQAAAAGGVTMGSAGDLTTRMADMAAHPDKYTDAQRDAIVDEYNRAVDSAAARMGAGALG